MNADGACPTAAALEHHCFYSTSAKAAGNVQWVIDDPVLSAAETTDGAPPTLRNLIVPEEYAVIAGTTNRNILNFRVAEMLAAEGGAELAEALENAGDADGDDAVNDD